MQETFVARCTPYGEIK
jgi:hypothetical protein